MKIIVKVAIVIVAVVIFLGSVGAIVYFSTSAKQNTTTSPIVTIAPTPTETPTATTTPQTTSTPTPTMTPTPYVEVDYTTIGWFYGAIEEYSGYNYTYLALNVTITDHGYSQVNPDGSNGFGVVVNRSTFPALFFPPFTMYNSSTINGEGYYFGDSALPSSATLLNTGSITGIVVFQFGDPNVYPAQPQILNAPFVLQYSVTYGNPDVLFPTNAKVIINQVG